MANLKCHMPIMVNVAVYAMQFKTGPEFIRELSFGVKIGGPKRGSVKKLADGNMAFLRVRGLQSLSAIDLLWSM